ncbi:NAD-dependent deacylase [Thermoactinomyces intermedius]|jgi:NAD-dependent deacetylase|uniref:protein acetyllysine N-acetyltransferase n=1 Tax=Thermoactinomyces intermedius TaxID=2024 RepID=A0A8I1A6X9_THEIN|nr:NAD-dependent deacylase [Thermoactinomyces intermedius]MBA4549704.1 NAD-dependent deacylase [Thermoactinomyces intermedius]MBA4835054.1 NAD-dependent deacylase [Thermoactinomyces intermedius]MBH8595939.1 NAD-dependent deacylase [Thermoactinomyces intermedius]
MREWVKKVQNAKHLVVLTGAGMSTESGLPDFRSQGGLWSGRDPNEIATPGAIGTKDFFEFYQMRVEELLKHHPNIGHYVLAELEKEGMVKAILTQNIDGFHQRAGSQKVIEIHGHMRHLVCSGCGKAYPATSYREGTYYCTDEQCRAPLRPPIVLFGEPLDTASWNEAVREVEQADLILVMGTSLQVYPFAGLVEIAHETGSDIILINKSSTPLDSLADQLIRDSIGLVLSEGGRVLLGEERLRQLEEKVQG